MKYQLIIFTLLSGFVACFTMYADFYNTNASNNFGFNDTRNQGNYGFAHAQDVYDANNLGLIASYFRNRHQQDDLDISTFYKMREDNQLIQATIHGNFQAVMELLQQDIDLNTKNKDGVTALHFAAVGNYADIARLLLKFGANPNVQNNEGDTPLHIASKQNAFGVAEALMKSGAQLLENNENKTPFDYASNDRMRNILHFYDVK